MEDEEQSRKQFKEEKNCSEFGYSGSGRTTKKLCIW